jgi:prophage antirepressor-like protein
MALQLFQHGDWNVRVVRNGDEVRWVAKDVAQCFGYKRPKDAIREHVRPDWKCPLRLFLRGGDSPPLSSNRHNDSQLLVISDCGVYALFFGSKLPCAEPYRAWLFGEVLPAIQRTGTYSVATPLQDAGDVIRMLADRVNGSVTVRAFPNTTKGAMFEADGLGRAVGYRTPELSVLYHAKQAGRESWCYQRDLDGGESYRVFVTKEVVLRVLLRSYKPATKSFRNWAFKNRLPERKALLA